MVQIIIKPDGKNIKEVTLIELQGDLESKSQSSLADCFVGDLHYTKDNVPILIIGHHILYGKVVNLDKPLAVLVKKSDKKKNQDNETTTPMKVDGETNSKSTEYLVTAVVRKKLIFKTRPKPIITNVTKKI